MRVTVTMRVSVLLGLASILLRGRLMALLGVRGCQQRLVGGRVGGLELCELRVIVTIVTGDSGIVGVWKREEMLQRQPQRQRPFQPG